MIWEKSRYDNSIRFCQARRIQTGRRVKKRSKNALKLGVGLLISGFFLYLAFGRIDSTQLLNSFLRVNYWLLIPAIFVQFISHWLRALRWRYFLKPIKRVPVGSLFSATMIGYMLNSVLPAHLGELFRAVVIGKRENIASSSVMASIVVERIIDILSLLLVMVMALLVYPFPDWVTTSGYAMFALAMGLLIFLYLLKQQHALTTRLLDFFLGLLPQKISRKVKEMLDAFINGISGFEKKRDALVILVYSVLMWICYWAILHILFYAFDLFGSYQVNTVSSVVLLVITTVSVVIPSSPGYVGTYHYLCQLALSLFGIPRAVGLSYAFVAHALTLIPTALVGFIFAWKEGLNRLNVENTS